MIICVTLVHIILNSIKCVDWGMVENSLKYFLRCLIIFKLFSDKVFYEQIMACSVDCLSSPHHTIHPSINQSMWNDGLYNFMKFFFGIPWKTGHQKNHTHKQSVELEYFWEWRRIRCETSVHYYAFWACRRCLHHLVERFINNLLELCQKKREKKDEKIL